MKKNINIVLLIVTILFGTTGCSEWLNLKPESEIILDDYWMSEADVEAVLASCYRGMTEQSVVYRMIVWGELRSDNIISATGFPNERYDMQRILNGELISTNSYCSWAPFYKVINYCNTLLYYAPKVLERDNNFTQADLNRVSAEARAIRALAYFYLVRTFKEVPLVEEPSIDDKQNYIVKKKTEREVLDFIISDLKFAQQYARPDFGKLAYNKGRMTLSAVNTILSDVYLWDKQYDNCVKTCDLVLADSKLSLKSSETMYSQVFYVGNSTESIFELQFDDKGMVNVAVNELYGSSDNMFGELSFPAALAFNPDETDDLKKRGTYSPFAFPVSSTIESANDIRAKESYRPYGGDFFIFKYAGSARFETTEGKGLFSYRTNTPNWIVYRLSDVMLMKAEALVEMDTEADLNESLSLVNTVYLRSNNEADSLKTTNYNTKYKMENLVLRERHREFLFEGKRWFDLVRLSRRENSTLTLNDFVDHKASGNSVMVGAPVMDALYMPIAESELAANPELVQNEYYKQSISSSSR